VRWENSSSFGFLVWAMRVGKKPNVLFERLDFYTDAQRLTLYEGGEIDAHLVSLAQMTNSSTTVQLRNAAPLLYSICWQQLF
jgi:hypothetical protein